jgi:hypothetical protein
MRVRSLLLAATCCVSVIAQLAYAASPSSIATDRLRGVIIAVDPIGNTLDVETSSGIVTLAVDANAQILLKHAAITLADLAAGNKVAIVYTDVDGKIVAIQIKEKIPKAK